MSNIADLIGDEGLLCHASQSLLNHLVGELLGYKDEGKELSPTVLFCTDSGPVFESFPGSVRHVVGLARLETSAVKRILKDCAPLATRNWNIFIERMDDQAVRYGVFNYISLPTTLPLVDALEMISGPTCLLIRKTSTNTIELRGSKGNELTLGFSTTREAEVSDADPVVPFAHDCCSEIADEVVGDFIQYFARLLGGGLASCHGTMLACAQDPTLSTMQDMKDGIEIDPKLDFFASYKAYRADRSAESIIRLQSVEELLFGILQCDGILLFDTLGCLLAYRVFYRPSTPAPSGNEAPVGGGSRRRAFESAKSMVGPMLKSLLFRSQDGLTIKEGGA